MDSHRKSQLVSNFLVAAANISAVKDKTTTYDVLSALTAFSRYIFCEDMVVLLSQELSILSDYLKLFSLSCTLRFQYRLGKMETADDICLPILYLIDIVDTEVSKAVSLAKEVVGVSVTISSDPAVICRFSIDKTEPYDVRIPLNSIGY